MNNVSAKDWELNREIAKMYDKAGEAGDTATVYLCMVALGNTEDPAMTVEQARAECARLAGGSE